MARLTSLFPSKIIQEENIIAWCAECETEWCGDVESMVTYTKHEMSVSNYQAQLPCHVYRILDVYTDPTDPNSVVPYYNNGAYLVFNSTMTEDTVYMNYYGIAIDQETDLEIPFKDIISIKKHSEHPGAIYYRVLVLKNGKTIEGRIYRGHRIQGKTEFNNMGATFNKDILNLESLIFEDSSK